ncbi:type 4a pilus biogenesis protein PilO [bacterium]|nr:type 4a pilus biogenesis protein PilO [bacterium]
MGLKEDFQDLSPSKCLAGGLVLAGVYFALVFDNGKDLETQITQTQNSIQETKVRLTAVENALEDKTSTEARATAITKELEELLKFFPANINVNDFQKDISSILKKTNNRLLKMQDEKVDGRFPGYVEQGIKLESEGGFHEAMDFLSAMTKMPRMIDIKSLKFDSTGSTDEMSLVKIEMLLTVFSYDAAAEKAANPGAPPVPGATPPPPGAGG